MGRPKGHILTCPCSSLSLDFFPYVSLPALSALPVCLSVHLSVDLRGRGGSRQSPHSSHPSGLLHSGASQGHPLGTWRGLLSLGSLWIPWASSLAVGSFSPVFLAPSFLLQPSLIPLPTLGSPAVPGKNSARDTPRPPVTSYSRGIENSCLTKNRATVPSTHVPPGEERAPVRAEHLLSEEGAAVIARGSPGPNLRAPA